MHMLKLIVIFLCVWGFRADGYYDFPPSGAAPITYESMPELFLLDDYWRCLAAPSGTYCVVDIDLLPDQSPLYQYIENYSKDTLKHFRHTRLHRGVCVSSRCGVETGDFTESKHKVTVTESNVTVTDLSGTATLFSCLNASIYEQYSLQVERVSVQYCDTAGSSDPIDAVDIAVGALLSVILFLNLACTAYHLHIRQEGTKKEVSPYVVAFSLAENWRALRHGSPDGVAHIPSMQGLRFYTMFIIIVAHSFVIAGHGYIKNPQFIEEVYNSSLLKWALNGRVVVQTFFVLSGFLLARAALAQAHLTLRSLPRALLLRWWRLAPSLAVCAGVAATWAARTGAGPLWGRLVGRERAHCRASWWANMLLMHNYLPFGDLCLPQTWYVAADTQLFAVGLLVMVGACAWPRRAPLLLGLALAAGLLAPALHTYLQDLLPIRAALYPETFLNLFAENPTFFHAYVSAQANLGGFTLGMITAYIYHRALNEKWNLEDSKVLKVAYFSSVPLGALAIAYGGRLHDTPAPAPVAAAFNSLDQNIFAAAVCVFLLGALHRCDDVMRSIVEWAPLQPLGRLSYGALLLHTTVLRTYVGHLTHSFQASVYSCLFLSVGTCAVTYPLAAALYLLVERPAASLLRPLLAPRALRSSPTPPTYTTTAATSSMPSAKNKNSAPP